MCPASRRRDKQLACPIGAGWQQVPGIGLRLEPVLGTMLLLAAGLAAPAHSETFEYRLALPGYADEFPRDHGAHDDFRTEWWYFTGHLKTPDGQRYGYELTFFRAGLRDKEREPNRSKWDVRDLYFAHFAVTDISGKRFHYFERRGRTGVGVAGISEDPLRIRIGDWSLLLKDEKFVLEARDGELGLRLELSPQKAPVAHGLEGVSQKSEGRGQATHYYSLTRMKTEGTLTVGGRPAAVSGVSWMDHEFGSNQLSKEQVGWDWFSVQLDDDTELMLYQMRRKDGTRDPNSSGSFIAAGGSKRHLRVADFEIEPTGEWTSTRSKARYPMGWKISIEEPRIELQLEPELRDQELITRGSTQVTYWEGCVRVSGESEGKEVSGKGYVEMTGYAGSLGGRQ